METIKSPISSLNQKLLSNYPEESFLAMQLPNHFIKTIQGTFGEKGQIWLKQLPDLIQTVQKRYALTVKYPVPNLSFNYVTTALRADGSEVMLKLGVPNKELSSEIALLRLCDGRGTVCLLDGDEALGVLVLERLQPGHSLVALFPDQDQRAVRIAATAMQQFWRPVPRENPFPTVYDWSFGLKRLRNAFDGRVGPFPQRLVEQAEKLFAELIPSMEDVVVLHGDLHHDNILSATREPWLIIDPKGIVGEPAYEIGAFLRNPTLDSFTFSDLHRCTEQRVAIFAEMLNLDRHRLIGWGLAQAVLSSWWSYESRDKNWADVLKCAQVLSKMLG